MINEKQKILIYTWSTGIGDGIMNSGYVREIKKMYPNSEIDICASNFYLMGYENNPYIEKSYSLIYYKRKFLKSLLIHMFKLLELRGKNYDLVLDVSSSYQKFNFRFLKIINGKKTIGIYKQGNRYGYTKEKLMKLYTELHSSVYEYFNINNIPQYDFFISQEKKLKAENFWKDIPSQKIKIIFNGEGGGKKQLSNQKIIESLKKICSNEKYEIAVIATPDSRGRFQNIISQIDKKNLRLCYETDIFDAGALIKSSDLLVSLDTSLVHIASAIGTKVVGIYANMGHCISTFAPKFVDYRIITQKEPSKADYDLENFSVKELIENIKSILEEN